MAQWQRISLSLFSAVILGLLGVAIYTQGPSSEMADLLRSDPMVELREEIRPAHSNGPRVLVLALDGVGAREFQDAMDKGALPRIGALFGEKVDDEAGLYEHGFAPKGVLSILPSTTFAAWTAVYTGVGAGQSGVPGNEWFDRATMTFLAPAPVSITGHDDAIRAYTDHFMDTWMAVPTVFEQADVRSYVAFAPQYRGADLLLRPDSLTFAELVSSFATGALSGEADREAYCALDIAAIDLTLDGIEEYGLADLQVVYFPGIDLFSHMAESTLSDQTQYLSEVIDPAVGRLLGAYGDRGQLDSTYILVVSDHGHTPTRATERNALGTGEEGEAQSALDSAGFRVRPFEWETDNEHYQAVLAYQGAMAYVYLADRSSCPEPEDRCDWRTAPRLEEDVLAAVRALDEAGSSGTHAAKLKGAIDLIFARTPRGIESADPFKVWNGDALIPVDTYLKAHPRPDLLNLKARLEALGTGPYGHRSGDIILLSRSREADPVGERFYFSAPYQSWHGSPSRQDSEIVFALARQDATGEALRTRLHEAIGDSPSQLDVSPLILDLLNQK